MIKPPSQCALPACSSELDTPIVDGFGRAFTYLRISITDLCNLRCVYCMPESGVKWIEREQILTFEEIVEVVQAAASVGVRKIRITGGEPLLRKGLPDLIHKISSTPGIQDLGLTTNGTHLKKLAKPLFEAGLTRINISMDTMSPSKFERIARRGSLADVWQGVEAAEQAGFHPLKVNVVVMGGLNEEEVVEFARMTIGRKIEIRFIELMPMGEVRDCSQGTGTFTYISNDRTRERIEEQLGVLRPVEMGNDNTQSATRFQLPGAKGKIGFISAMSTPFCATCSRLRMTAEGKLCSCLLEGGESDLRTLLRTGKPVEKRKEGLIRAFAKAAWMKPEVHGHWAEVGGAAMHRLGG